jgi:hypothetical protein
MNDDTSFDLYIHDDVVQYNGLLYMCISISNTRKKPYFKWRSLGVATGFAATTFWGNLLPRHNPLRCPGHATLSPFSTGS